MIMTIEDRIRKHLPEPKDTLACYECFRNESFEDRDKETGELIGFITYFFLDFNFDMIICAAEDDRFTKSMWRVLRDTIKYRVKPLRIQSDPQNEVLHRAAKKYGGYFTEDGELYFPKPK